MSRVGRHLRKRPPSLYRQPRKYPKRLAILGVVVVLLVVALGIVQLVRKVPPDRLVLSVGTRLTVPGRLVHLPWPASGEGVVALRGARTMASFGPQAEVPIASVTKMMTALVVLRTHPLAVGTSGPTITVSAKDLASYDQELAAGDSVVKVHLGEHLSELQALEGLLIPSGDNMADLLARWDAGSRAAFVAKMNALAAPFGLHHTHYVGVSGVDPANVSTARDQLRVARRCMRIPAFASIVAMPQVTLPVAGVQYNVNGDLGTDGIIGVKTGWVPAGGADFVFAASRPVAGHSATLIGAVLGEQGASPLPSVLSATKRLVVSAGAQLRTRLLLRPGQVVGALHAPNGPAVPVVTTRAARLFTWPGARVTVSTSAATTPATTLRRGTSVGAITLSLGRERAVVPLALRHPLSAPPLLWRLTRA